MTTPWRKSIRDFQQEGTRTLLVVVAIAIGIVGFDAVLSTYAVLRRELKTGYLASNPASATLQTDAVDDAVVTAVLSDHDVSDAEPRKAVSASIKTGPVQWRNLVLFAVKDYGNMRISKFVPDGGAWPPATGEVLIERDAFWVARAEIGDTVTIKIGRGKEQTLRVSGGVHDVGQPQARMENTVYGYVTLATLAQLGEQPTFDQLKILVAENRFDENHVRDVAGDVKQLLESRGHSVAEVTIPPPGKHPHAALMDVLLLAMSSFGLFVLVMSAILVVNLLLAIMASQVRQIGVMKAIGGTQGQVMTIYFTQALLMGIAATSIALPLGLLASRPLCRAFARFLNFDVTSFAVPGWVYAVVSIVGLATPVLGAAWPVWKGSATSVREALAAYGVSERSFGTGAFDRAVAAIGGNFRPLLLAIRNSFRRRTRLVLTLVTLAASGVFFMCALNIRASMMNTLDHSLASRKYDLLVSLGSLYPTEKIERAVRKTPGVVSSESWFGARASIASTRSGKFDGSLNGFHFPIIALPADPQMITLQMMQGRNLLPSDVDAIVVNNALAENSQIKVGDTITLSFEERPRTWHVVGIAREPFLFPTGYIRQAYLEQSHPGMRNTVGLALARRDAASIYAIRSDLDRNLEQEGIQAVGGLSKADWRAPFDQHYLMLFVFLVVMSGIIAVVGGLGLATTISLNVMERRREIGVLRAIGASPPIILGIIVTEGVVIGIISWVLAALAAWRLSPLVGNFLTSLLFKSKLDSVFQLQGLWIWLAIVVFFSAVASLLPARSAARLTVREALAYE